MGWADPKLLPPPHVFLGDIVDQAKFFNTVSRWQVGVGQDSGPSPPMAVLYTVLSTTGRVFAGLAIAASLGVSIGVAIRYFKLFEKLTLPTVTLLAPVSPIAWLPVAIFVFGIGDAPGRIYDFPERQQRRYVQRNDSWGRVVPIETLAREVGMKRAGLRQGELWRRGDRVR